MFNPQFVQNTTPDSDLLPQSSIVVMYGLRTGIDPQQGHGRRSIICVPRIPIVYRLLLVVPNALWTRYRSATATFNLPISNVVPLKTNASKPATKGTRQ
jgi:hypothetical protein